MCVCEREREGRRVEGRKGLRDSVEGLKERRKEGRENKLGRETVHKGIEGEKIKLTHTFPVALVCTCLYLYTGLQ